MTEKNMAPALDFYEFLLKRFGFNSAIAACVARAISVAFGRDGATAIQRVNTQVSNALFYPPIADTHQNLSDPESPASIVAEKKRPVSRQNAKKGTQRKNRTSPKAQDDVVAND